MKILKNLKNINYKLFLNNGGIIDISFNPKTQTKKKNLKFLSFKDINQHILWKHSNLNLLNNKNQIENSLEKFQSKYNKLN